MKGPDPVGVFIAVLRALPGYRAEQASPHLAVPHRHFQQN